MPCSWRSCEDMQDSLSISSIQAFVFHSVQYTRCRCSSTPARVTWWRPPQQRHWPWASGCWCRTTLQMSSSAPFQTAWSTSEPPHCKLPSTFHLPFQTMMLSTTVPDEHFWCHHGCSSHYCDLFVLCMWAQHNTHCSGLRAFGARAFCPVLVTLAP